MNAVGIECERMLLSRGAGHPQASVNMMEADC
jgi:hypothetical protein